MVRVKWTDRVLPHVPEHAGLKSTSPVSPVDRYPPGVLRRARLRGLWWPCADQLTLNTRYSTPPANRRPSATKRLVVIQL
jgi:hypothetical protein